MTAKNRQQLGLLERREQLDRLPVAGAAWMVVEAGDNEEQAATTFAKRHGSHPEHVVDYGGYLWLGPVPSLKGMEV